MMKQKDADMDIEEVKYDVENKNNLIKFSIKRIIV